MIRRPPRSTPLYSSAASDVYKRQASTRTSRPLGPPLGADRASGLVRPASRPVSYTHLRAHETKANLVCRLLLEKKKHTKKKKSTRRYQETSEEQEQRAICWM